MVDVEVDDDLAIDMLIGISKGERMLMDISRGKRPLVEKDDYVMEFEDDDELVMEFVDDGVSVDVMTKKPKTTPCFDELKKWLKCNLDDPYPTTDKIIWFIETSDLTETQVLNWFSNARRRWPELKGKHKGSGRRKK
jgi:hypothetical protein